MERSHILSLISAGKQPNGEVSTAACVRLPILAPWLLSISFNPGRVAIERMADAVQALTQIPFPIRFELERALFEYYLECVEHGSADFATAQDLLDWEADFAKDFPRQPAPQSPSDIWRLVRFKGVTPAPSARTGRMMVRVSGDCAWDGEHGVCLFFEENGRFLRVGDHAESAD